MSEARTGRPTSADVAHLAGVSRTTVSLVMSGKATRISRQTRERVLLAVGQLGYRPNQTAQRLRRGSSGTMGFLTDRIAAGSFSGAVVSAVHDVAWEHRSTLLMMNTTRNSRRLDAAVDGLLDHGVDGLLYAAAGTRPVRMPRSALRLRTVLINAFDVDGVFPAVVPDERAGGRAAVDHLIGLGHEHIVFVAGRRASWATRERVTAFRQGLLAAGLTPALIGVRYGDYRLHSGYTLAMDVLTLRPRPTALLCGNDQMAVGAYLACARLGLSIPGDVSIVGYDNDPTTADLDPGLTTVTLPLYELGRRGAEIILGIAEPDAGAGTKYLDCSLVVRGSTAPPA